MFANYLSIIKTIRSIIYLNYNIFELRLHNSWYLMRSFHQIFPCLWLHTHVHIYICMHYFRCIFSWFDPQGWSFRFRKERERARRRDKRNEQHLLRINISIEWLIEMPFTVYTCILRATTCETRFHRLILLNEQTPNYWINRWEFAEWCQMRRTS